MCSERGNILSWTARLFLYSIVLWIIQVMGVLYLDRKCVSIHTLHKTNTALSGRVIITQSVFGFILHKGLNPRISATTLSMAEDGRIGWLFGTDRLTLGHWRRYLINERLFWSVGMFFRACKSSDLRGSPSRTPRQNLKQGLDVTPGRTPPGSELPQPVLARATRTRP